MSGLLDARVAVVTGAGRGIGRALAMALAAEDAAVVISAHRVLEPEELGPTAVLLASEAGGAITGQVVHVDGGWKL